jgi:flagellar secretion chaperone FliS
VYATTHSHYRSQAVETAGPAQLVLMLYDGVLAAVTRAEQALEGGHLDLEAAHHELSRAQAILSELSATLDLERGGQIAGNLAALYEFCLHRLVEANLRKDPAGLGDVRAVVADLRDAWETACCGAVPAMS